MGKRKITITVDEKVFTAFKRFCSANAMKISTKTELMMRDALDEAPATTMRIPKNEPKEDDE